MITLPVCSTINNFSFLLKRRLRSHERGRRGVREAQLIETVKQCGGLAPSEIIARVMQAADQFVAGAKQHDDMIEPVTVIMRVPA